MSEESVNEQTRREPEFLPGSQSSGGGRGASRARWYLPLLAALLVLIAGGLYWQSRQMIRLASAENAASSTALRTQMDTLAQRIDALTAQFAGADNARQRVDQALNSLSEKQAAQQQQINAAVSSIAHVQGRTETISLLGDAQHLLSLAEQSLRLTRDVPTAIAAAEHVDSELAASNDSSLIPVREQVLADLGALRAVSVVDTAGISIKLSNLIDEIDALPLKSGDLASSSNTASTEPSTDTSAPQGWRGIVARMWKDLLSLVDIKKTGAPDEVLFNPDKRYLLLQGLKLEVAAARLDVLRSDTAAFQSAIARIDARLERYFDSQAQSVAAARATLAPWKNLDLAPALPGFDKSLQLLRAHAAEATTKAVESSSPAANSEAKPQETAPAAESPSAKPAAPAIEDAENRTPAQPDASPSLLPPTTAAPTP
jgi:uroporphyrin-3 C-methyltransferase